MTLAILSGFFCLFEGMFPSFLFQQTLKNTLDKWIIIFGIALYLFHFLERNPSNPYERPIISDAKGYYAYLPALFIYQDFDYQFIETVDEKYYAVGKTKHIFNEIEGEKVNKTFPGIALLYMPFFLIAHALALLWGWEADGYSLVYQYLFDFGQFFYATVGLLLAGRILLFLKFNKIVAFISIIGVVLTTNLWFYIVYDQSVTHVYNFFLISSLILQLCRLQYTKFSVFRSILLAATFALILIVRPTGILALLLVPIFFDARSFIGNLKTNLWSPKNGLAILFGGVVIGSIPLLLWKAQSGHWFVYSYGEEGFDFMDPQWTNFLFSYAKGWWVYSPAILLIILSGVWFFIQHKAYQKVASLMVFLVISIYVFSSWWCWYYGFAFGQRPMVDFYVVYMYLLAFILSSLTSRWSKSIAAVILMFAGFLNLHQSFQHYHGYFHTATPTKEMFWDNFLAFRKSSRVYPEENWELLEQAKFTFEEDNTAIKGERITSSSAFSGKHLISVDQSKEFSTNVFYVNEHLQDADHIVVSFMVKALTNLEELELICEAPHIADSYKSFNIDSYVVKDKWMLVELAYPKSFKSDTLHIYFWNKNKSEVADFDDLEITLYSERK